LYGEEFAVTPQACRGLCETWQTFPSGSCRTLDLDVGSGAHSSIPQHPGSTTEADKEIIGSRNVCLLDLLLASVGKLLEALETIILQSWPQKIDQQQDFKKQAAHQGGCLKWGTRNNPRDQKIKSFG